MLFRSRAGDPKAILDGLMQKRHPIYARADITFESGDQTVDELVERVREKLRQENILDAV